MVLDIADALTRQDGSAVISGRIKELQKILEPFLAFFTRYKALQEAAGTNACDFVLGNPQDGPLGAYTEALHAAIEPRSADWYAYTESLPGPGRSWPHRSGSDCGFRSAPRTSP